MRRCLHDRNKKWIEACLYYSDNNGNKLQKFYLRSGNSSQELGLTEISDYISKGLKLKTVK